jgi:hypothetical protein
VGRVQDRVPLRVQLRRCSQQRDRQLESVSYRSSTPAAGRELAYRLS